MIIGVDAGCLGVKDERLKVGVHRVASNLLKQLAKIDKKNQYRLYSFYPIEEKFLKGVGERMENVVLRPKRGWFTARLPLELKLHPVDIFLGLSQALPFSSSHNILVVYDLAFEHYPEFYPSSLKKLKKNTQTALTRADKIITISHSTKKDLIGLYNAQNDKINVFYPGVDDSFSPKGEKFNLDTPYFLFIGALKRVKNVPLILKAFAQFLKKTKNKFKLVLVGGDLWLDPEIKKTIRKLKLTEKVLMTWFVKDEDLPKFYRGASAFISPSLYEGFGMTHLEAMACGTAVVGSNVSSLPEVIGKAGILVDPRSEKETSQAMLKVVFDKKFQDKLIKKGINQAKNFSWQKFANQILELIERL